MVSRIDTDPAAERLSEIIAEELDRDDWGDISPSWFSAADRESSGPAHERPLGHPMHTDEYEARKLLEVMERVVWRLVAEEGWKL